MALLVDTGILYALADTDDRWHARARAWLTRNRETVIVPVTVVPEVCYLLHTRLGPDVERQFVRSLVDEELALEALQDRDLARAAELLDSYPRLGFVDLSLVAMAERLRIGTIATTDRRHFAQVEPSHVPAFSLIPE